MKVKVVANGLTPEIYITLRQKVGFQKYDADDIEAALKQTLFSVVVYVADQPVGIARVVGDDRIVFFIKDVVVDPDFQHQSIGSVLMESVMRHIYKRACKNAYVGLMATPNTEKFYEKFGFIRRPNQNYGCGMVKYILTEEENESPLSLFETGRR